MGYSLRTDQYRYTAFFKWNGTSQAPIIPATTAAVGAGTTAASAARVGGGGGGGGAALAPRNGTDGFYFELFEYGNATAAVRDIDALDVVEQGRVLPAVAAELYTTLVGLIT